MRKQTTGPWLYKKDYGVSKYFDDYVIVCPGKPELLARVYDLHSKKEDVVANARLIAAAPDLLAACKQMVVHTDCSHCRLIAEAVIAKATEVMK